MNRTAQFSKLFSFSLIVSIYVCLGTSFLFAQTPYSKKVDALQHLDALPVFKLQALDNDALLKRDENVSKGTPLQFAEPQMVHITPENEGIWENSDGKDIWRMKVSSENALSLNFGFSTFKLPQGATLTLFSEQFASHIQTYTAEDNESHEELWTPIIPGDEVILELVVPKKLRKEVQLTLGQISHAYRPFGLSLEEKKTLNYKSTLSGSCNVDVVCGASDGFPEIDAWRNQIRSVAKISINGSSFCSGALINNTSYNGKPYFLTANHCGITPSNAASVNFYWNYENSVCRQPNSTASGNPGNGTVSQTNSGAIFRAAYGPSDFTLVELDDYINPAYNVHYSGWDRRDIAPTKAVTIHHPSAEEKRISFENNPTAITKVQASTPSSDGTHLRIADWDLGTTEGGSSGSPLYNPEGFIVGMLTSGDATCATVGGSEGADWYGRFYSGWEGGGSINSGLKYWLDTANTGQETLSGFDFVPTHYLNIEKRSTPSVATYGSSLSITLSIENEGNFPLSNVTITDQIKPGLTYVNGSASCNGVYNNGVLNMTLETLGAKQVETCTYYVNVDLSATPRIFFSDNMESGASNWQASSSGTSNKWTRVNNEINAYSGNYYWYAQNITQTGDQYLNFLPTIQPDANSYLSIQHKYSTEESFDGGVIEYSSNGGTTWQNVGNRFLQNGYGLALSTEYGNALGGTSTFSGRSPGYIESIVYLGDFAGQDIKIRFRLSTDSSEGVDGWYVDDVQFQSGFTNFVSQACATANGISSEVCTIHSVTVASTTDNENTEENALPNGFALTPAYPNPFNPSTQFSLTVAKNQKVQVEVFNMLGQKVQTIFNGFIPAFQNQKFVLDASSLPSGNYLYRVIGEYFSTANLVTFVK